MPATWTTQGAALGIQGLEWIVLLIVLAILFMFGPKKIPELLRGLGRGMGEFQRGRQEIERELKRDIAEAGTEDERREFEQRVVRVARELSIPVDARSQREIKMDIVKAMDTSSRERVVMAAKGLGVATEGVELQVVKEGVVKKLAV
jgi:TatA/E family protein of Tat protein translocase